ncbi:type IV toxin-antitoxin system AbiEi family antitoxin domain-containing protein [Occultella gossypii]|uniref:Type IV toxin-antitoxin system AbiEi family antitoxin domain-containing protein n=1 Tax=Occultella gossypii TaxID=2800820 RepID=A0ABS7SJP1_9MICO|nr:type IV toxin-antitoxin system AbiEi family antitoxin domain-containing protein [Occultella gossypii]MBZ2199508.1 type IV toxin-antitoxin system AbiEi family antitoxin domain-containing protein [Occultella gossypii]
MRKVSHPDQATALARSQGGLISARQCDELGISGDRRTALVRHGLWYRVVRSVYDCQLPTDDGNAFDRRRRRSAWIALLAAGPDAVATGMCALVLHGVWGLPQVIAPEAMLPGVRANRGPVGVRIRRGPRTGRIVRVGSARAVDVRTALIQALPELDRNTAVAVMDSALNRELIDTEGLAWVRRHLRARRGARRLEAWWPLVDGRAESPLETHARLDCLDHGLPPEELQLKVRDGHGRLLGRGDLAWRREDGTWVVAEVDGEDIHSATPALYRDRNRQNDFAIDSDVTQLRFAAPDVYRPGAIAAKVRAALASNVRSRGRTGRSAA